MKTLSYDLIVIIHYIYLYSLVLSFSLILMAEYIDTHAHLYLPEFDADRESVVETCCLPGCEKNPASQYRQQYYLSDE